MINLTDYNDFFLFLGGFLVIGGVIYIVFRHSLKNIFIPEEEISKARTSNQISIAKISLPKISISVILLAIIIGAFLFNQFLMWRMNSSNFLSKLFNINITITKK